MFICILSYIFGLDLGIDSLFRFPFDLFSPHTNTIIRFSERGPCIILGSILTSYSVPTFLLSLPLLLLFLLLFGFHWFSLKEFVVFLFYLLIYESLEDE